ncbi:16S rRNA (cytosine(1402)-N(4))-methyltransferase, partial [Enterococcus faecium]|nr:16S rRNA (cytosine(1402)-N(4))-methyltransferase [Enterococcus faecium]
MTEFKHTTVLLEETVNGLDVKEDGIYVDCTLGGGGHSRLILSKLGENGHLYSFDQDQTAIDYNQKNLAEYVAKGQVTFVKSNFRNLKNELNHLGIDGVDGVLYDLGVSSPQFDDAERGFSYRFDAPLDM